MHLRPVVSKTEARDRIGSFFLIFSISSNISLVVGGLGSDGFPAEEALPSFFPKMDFILTSLTFLLKPEWNNLESAADHSGSAADVILVFAVSVELVVVR